MSHPIESVARVAATPGQAKVFVALLQAAGIPARVEGDSLADEFAASRRLMNLLGTKVMVPTASLAEARALLEPVAIDEEDLSRQALAEPRETAPAARRRHPAATRARRIAATLVALLVIGIAVSVVLALR